jgi:hypothetical protein
MTRIEVAVLAFLALGCGCQPTVQSKPPIFEFKLSEEQRRGLSHSALKMVEEMEAGRVSGANVDEFYNELQNAEKIADGKTWKRYYFKVYRDKPMGEGQAVIWVQVDKATQQIIGCGVAVPIW